MLSGSKENVTVLNTRGQNKREKNNTDAEKNQMRERERSGTTAEQEH